MITLYVQLSSATCAGTSDDFTLVVAELKSGPCTYKNASSIKASCQVWRLTTFDGIICNKFGNKKSKELNPRLKEKY